MAGFKSNVILTIGAVIFSLFLQNVHSRAQYSSRYSVGPRPRRIAQTSLTPIYTEFYHQCRHEICSDSDDYPEEEILRVMRNTKHLEGLFGIVLNSTYDTTELASRSSFTRGKAKKLCSTETSETITPRILRNINLTWKYVVNVEGYYQRFTAEMCRFNKSTSSGKKSTDFCTDFDFECRQSTQEIYLLTFENGIIDFDKFLIPTTCNCVCGL